MLKDISFQKEAIFELKKVLSPIKGVGVPAEVKSDPDFRFLIGSLFDKVKDDYSFKEVLPASEIPDEITPYVVKYRFRKGGARGWPLIQIGPGIIAYNETKNYDRETFVVGLKYLLDKYYSLLDKGLDVESLVLKYVFAENFDFSSDNALEYIESKLGITLKLPDHILTQCKITRNSKALNFGITYPIDTTYGGSISIHVGNGKSDGKEAIVWQITISSEKINECKRDMVVAWIDESHILLDKLFDILHKKIKAI